MFVLQKHFLNLIVLSVCIFLGGVHMVEASPSYSVTPLVISEVVEEPDILVHEITIMNTGTQPVTVYPTVNNISIDSGGGIQAFIPQVMSDQTSSLAAWMEISRAGIDIRVGETKTVSLTLRINPNPKEGEYHAFLGFGHGRNRDEAEAMVARGDAPGTIVTVQFSKNKLSLLKLSRFLVHRFVTSSENNAASYVIKNPGDEALTPTGEIILYDTLGVEVGSFPVNPSQLSIAPGEEQIFTAPVPIAGLFGKYKAFLSVEYGTANMASVQDTVFFYVFPLKIMLSIFGALLLLVVLVSLYIHRKYYDEGIDDGSELLPVHIRETVSDPLHHDIDLRQS